MPNDGMVALIGPNSNFPPENITAAVKAIAIPENTNSIGLYLFKS
jgi:hypothetical protein